MAGARSPERPDEAAAPPLSREEVLRILEQRGDELREELARHQDAEPEVLLFVAKEGNAAARRAVAVNPASPAVANRLLATDPEDEVRQELARKIGMELRAAVVDDHRVALSENAVAMIRGQVAAIESKMLEYPIVPGSAQARRLFS